MWELVRMDDQNLARRPGVRGAVSVTHQDGVRRAIAYMPDYGNGHSEEVLGRALRGRRGEAVLVTKCGQ